MLSDACAVIPLCVSCALVNVPLQDEWAAALAQTAAPPTHRTSTSGAHSSTPSGRPPSQEQLERVRDLLGNQQQQQGQQGQGQQGPGTPTRAGSSSGVFGGASSGSLRSSFASTAADGDGGAGNAAAGAGGGAGRDGAVFGQGLILSATCFLLRQALPEPGVQRPPDEKRPIRIIAQV